MQKITPFLWFDGQAEEAARFYTSIFKKSKIESISPMSATFRLEWREIHRVERRGPIQIH